MKGSLATFLLTAIIFISGCLPRHPERTVRPDVPLGEWAEKTVTSEATGQVYRYLHIAGPSGDAPTMLLLPGGFFDARVWLYFNNLAKYFNLYALDWPDDSPLYQSNVKDMGDVAADFLTSVKISKLHVTGVSAGAYPAIDLVVRHPGIKVQSLTIISSVMFGISKKEVRTRTRNSKIALCLKPDKMRAVAEWMVMRNEYKEAPGKIQQKDIFWVRPYSYYRQIFEMTRNQGSQKQATEDVDVPVFIMHGTKDEIIDYDTAVDNHTQFDDAKQISIEGGLHSMVFSEGPQLVKMMVAFFLKKGLLP